MTTPKIGSTIEILSLKHNHKMHRRWLKNFVMYSDDHLVIGGNDRTVVEESNKTTWRTTEPAIFYFDKRYWFNIVIVIKETDYYYYCNLSTPFTYKKAILQYIDYDIDVIVQSDLTYTIVDQKEFKENKNRYDYPLSIQYTIQHHLFILQEWINHQKDPFNKEFFDRWYHTFSHIKN